MPTIDQLEAAIVAADDDVLPVSQGGTARRVTRSQLLAGTQASLAITPGLLGRVSAGLGPPQYVSVGRNLSITDGVLSGSPSFSAATLPRSSSVGLADLVPVWQGGDGHAIDLRTLLSVSGIDVSTQTAKAPVGTARALGAWFGDAMAVEAFGAVGDGVTDDTPAFDAAIASGRPILLGPKVYRIDGQWTIQSSATLIGIPGSSTLRRTVQKGGAWINILGPRFVSVDIIFDAGSIAGDSWSVLVAAECATTMFRNCNFLNATGRMLGTGLTIQARDGLSGSGSSHMIDNCQFRSNDCHGLWIQAAAGAVVRDCIASHNAGYGICLDFNDPLFQQQVRQSSVTGCRCLHNSRGISVGNYNETNLEPPRWGLSHPDAADIVVSMNYCFGNQRYGIAVSGERIQVLHNQVVIEDGNEAGSGILCNAEASSIDGNVVRGPGEYGIDAGGCNNVSIKGNFIESCLVGINPGGSTSVDIIANQLVNNRRAVTVFQVETDGAGSNFGLACSNVYIAENTICFEAGNSGVLLLDGPERVQIVGNRFICPTSSYAADCFWGHSDSVLIKENSWNGASAIPATLHQVGASVQLTVSDILDEASVPPPSGQVDVISGAHEVEMIGKISFIRVTDAGRNYTVAGVMIEGVGSGAAATAYVRDGAVIGVAISSSGFAYDHATTSVRITGDGTGAKAQAFIGLKPGEGRTLTLRCAAPVSFGGDRGLTNWTGASITVPGRTDIVWRYLESGWNAVRFSNSDYLQPTEKGGILLRSVNGDLRLHSGSDGHVRTSSDTEPIGCLSCLGRGSPEGVIIAPPGSDYRNLDGGAGKTLWFKITGSDDRGWAAVA